MFDKLNETEQARINKIITGSYCIVSNDQQIKLKLDHAAKVYISMKSINKQAYQQYLQSDEWKQLAQQIKERDNHKCRICWSGSNLEVHHLTYDRIYSEKPYDLVTLCDKCHAMAHKIKQEY